jgi:hypothetical protein
VKFVYISFANAIAAFNSSETIAIAHQSLLKLRLCQLQLHQKRRIFGDSHPELLENFFTVASHVIYRFVGLSKILNHVSGFDCIFCSLYCFNRKVRRFSQSSQ